MKNWIVRIKGEVTKDIPVFANSEDAAVACAHNLFTTNCDGGEEKYDEQMLGVRSVEEGDLEFALLVAQAEKDPWDPRFRPVSDLPPPTDADSEIRCVVVWQDDENPTDVGVDRSNLAEIRYGVFDRPRYRGAVWMSVMGAAPFLFAESEMRGEAEEESDEEKE